ncbi:MAG: isoleucine--tRNA ligase [Calditerrivibrio sp.]|nr:isoleucine--tRNA ligase [Calditerrivibrio sp.]
MDYKNSLHLPKTDFPMKANLNEQEPKRISKWNGYNLYRKILNRRENSKKYILHDGPPYANGNIHIGHALNKILKDFIVKIRLLEGYYAPYVPGWDCHGLPIEHQVDKELGDKKYEISKSEIRKMCRKYAEKYIDIQRDEFKRLGVLGDWENPYITMNYEYEAITLKELYKFFNNGGIYKGSKPVYWCMDCVTALAEAEVEYNDHTSHSIFVKFPVREVTKSKLGINGDLSVVIWTTTPWTLPANLGVAFHPEFKYSVIKINASENQNLKNGEFIILATELYGKLMTHFKVTEFEEVSQFTGVDFDRGVCKHPFYDRDSLMILGDHVTLEQGTGIVHTAPGHGQEDYEIGLKYGLDIYNPVDDYGKFKKDVELFAGIHVVKANKIIIDYMQDNGSLISVGNIEHSYPHCWRCKRPVIYRATPQWFISMESNNLRANALNEIKKVRWTPSWGENRITAMIENRPDWCISRQRSWGVPIAVFSCGECGEIIIDKEIQDRVVDSFMRYGADAWFDNDVEYFLGKDYKCPKCGSISIKKETDILDVWFDSGVSHAAVCEVRDELKPSADMYLEGSDQHRGWFHSSLLESVGTRMKAPYKEVLTHGFVVDGKGRKMSKSVGNVVRPQEIIEKYGAEVLRLWVAAEDYTEDVRISDDIIKRLVESYRKIRNTARYLLGNIYDFNFDTEAVPVDKMMELDRYIIFKWQKVKERIYRANRDYQFHIFYHAFINFCINELSSFYLDIVKDRIYSYRAGSLQRRSAQTAIFTLVKEMSIVMSPILSFTADEIWEYIPSYKNKSEFVFLELYPEILHVDVGILDKFDRLTEIKKDVNKALEIARVGKLIGHPLDAKVELYLTDKDLEICSLDEGLEKLFIVSELYVKHFNDASGDIYCSESGDIKVKVYVSENQKCERCWVRSSTVGKNSEHPTLCNRCVENI